MGFLVNKSVSLLLVFVLGKRWISLPATPLTKTRQSEVLKPALDSDALLVSDANPTYTAGFSHDIIKVKVSELM